MAKYATKYKPHTTADNSGEDNMTTTKIPKDEEGLMAKIYPMYLKGMSNQAMYKGLWTDEEFTQCVSEFFTYCAKNNFKPTKPALGVWMGVSKEQYWDWERKEEKYGMKSQVIKMANQIMETYLQANLDKYPTGSTFLLKTSHGHVEQSKVDITTNGQVTSAEEVKQLVAQLGLDKTSK